MPPALQISEVLPRVVVDSNGCHQWQGVLHKSGYGTVSFHGNHKAHRFFYECLVGPIPAGLYICHRCHVKRCVNPEHLYPGTQTQNMADMTAANRQARGEAIAQHKRGSLNAASKLSETQVLEMRQLRQQGHRLIDIARRYGVSEATACRRVREVQL